MRAHDGCVWKGWANGIRNRCREVDRGSNTEQISASEGWRLKYTECGMINAEERVKDVEIM